MQVLKSTNSISFCLVLSRHLPGPTTVFQPSALTFDSYVNTDPRLLMLYIQRKIPTLQAKVSYQLQKRRVQYKQRYNGRVQVEPDFVSSKWVFIDKPLLTDRTTADWQRKHSRWNGKRQLKQATAAKARTLPNRESTAAHSRAQRRKRTDYGVDTQSHGSSAAEMVLSQNGANFGLT